MNRFKYLLLVLLLVSCAGLDRSCSSCMATEFGADWVVVELTEAEGKPYRCWELRGLSITSEERSDGIYWKNNKGNLVHVAGSYDYVQVESGQWEDAFREINMTAEACAVIRNKTYDPAIDRYVSPQKE